MRGFSSTCGRPSQVSRRARALRRQDGPSDGQKGSCTDLRIGILASHDGTTLQAIIDACATGVLRAQVVTVVRISLMRRPKKGPVRLNASSQSIPNAAKARRLASRWRPSASMSVSSRSKKTPFNIALSPAADINGPRTVADSTTSACGSCRRRRPRISFRSFIRRYERASTLQVAPLRMHINRDMVVPLYRNEESRGYRASAA